MLAVRGCAADKAKAGATEFVDDVKGTMISLAIYLERKEGPARGERTDTVVVVTE